MSQFRKKPVVIEAVQLLWSTWSEMCDFASVSEDGIRGVYVNPDGSYSQNPPFFGEDAPSIFPDCRIGLCIPTLEGVMLGVEGDWIIKGVQGEFYPCKPDIFAATYERDALLVKLEEAHLARIEAQNPGIDMESVKKHRAANARALAADIARRTEEADHE